MYLPSQLHFLPGFLQSCPLKMCQLLEGGVQTAFVFLLGGSILSDLPFKVQPLL